MKGQPADSGYGCLGDTRLPSVPVGRLPARTEAEVQAMVRKTLEFENDRRPGAWRRRLTVLAGIPAYNPVVDRLVERLAVSRFDSSPADLQAMPKDDGPFGGARDRVMLANHQRANRFAIAEAEVDVRDGRFEARLAVPEKPPWPKLILRAYAFTERAEGLGVRKLAVGKR